jgi:hypothetical protein
MKHGVLYCYEERCRLGCILTAPPVLHHKPKMVAARGGGARVRGKNITGKKHVVLYWAQGI